MNRARISTTVDPDLLTRARRLDPGAADSVMVERALGALIASHRRAEIDLAYRSAYKRHPIDEPDEWGDLATFGDAVRGR